MNFLTGMKITSARAEPISEVISCVTENVVWNTAFFAAMASGRSIGIMNDDITAPINADLNSDPTKSESGKL